jgi:hypothetical protein
VTRVTPALRDAVFARDGRCVLFNLDPDHVCRDRWGQPHIASRTDLLTIEHVKRELRMGLRAENSMETMVAMCWAGNLGPPTKVQRQAIRAYLAEVNVEVSR